MTQDEIKVGDLVMTPNGKAIVIHIDSTSCLVPFLVEYQNKSTIWYSNELIHKLPPEQPPATQLFTATERRDRVWDLAASLWRQNRNLADKQCVEMAESLMVEFEATYNKEST